MATIQDLLNLAYQIRDAEQNGENTALRVGQFLVELVNHFSTKADVDNISGAYHLKQQQAPIMALMSVQQMSDSNGQDNKAWWSTDGHIKYQHNGRIYDLGTPAYMLYYCGDKIYKWTGSATGFQLMTDGGSSGGGASVFANFAVAASTNELPDNGVATTGYIVGQNLYAYVGTGGDTHGGKYQNLGELNAAGVSLTTNGDGTFTVHSGGNDYTVNLNHTHPNMAKLIVCEESDLPSTLDNSTIYAITDSGETEIEKLIIHGMEFAGGGGTPSTEPKIVSPIGTQIDFNGASTKTVTVRASNLSEALTIAVTGVTANLQTISANDAANGVQLTLTKGQSFTAGTLRIYSSEVDKSWNAIDSQMYQDITAVKFTKQQYVLTDIYPGPNTRIEIDMQFDGEFSDVNQDIMTYRFLSCFNEEVSSTPNKVFNINTGTYAQATAAQSYMDVFCWVENSYQQDIWELKPAKNIFRNRGMLVCDLPNHSFSYLGASISNLPTKTRTMSTPLSVGGGGSSIRMPFGLMNLIIYSIKHYESNVLTHEYLPKTLNGIAGLYDTKTDTFITSDTSVELVAINS